MPAKKSTRSIGPREQIAPHGVKRYVRRTKDGQVIKSQVSVSGSRSVEARQAARGQTAIAKVKSGYGDRGDVKRKAK